MKTTQRTVGIMALAGILSFTFMANSAMAAPKGDAQGPKAKKGGYHQVIDKLPEDKKAQYFEIIEEFRMDTAPLRDQLWAKRAQLKAISDDTTTDMKALTAITDSIVDLRAQLRKAAVAVDTLIEKEIGIDSKIALKGPQMHKGEKGNKARGQNCQCQCGPKQGHGHEKGHGPQGPQGERGQKDGKPCPPVKPAPAN